MADHEASDPGSEDEHGVQFEIDEQSDDEDEHQAFALLRAAPNSSVPPVEQTSSAVTQHGNRNFAVCILMLIKHQEDIDNSHRRLVKTRLSFKATTAGTAHQSRQRSGTHRLPHLLHREAKFIVIPTHLYAHSSPTHLSGRKSLAMQSVPSAHTLLASVDFQTPPLV